MHRPLPVLPDDVIDRLFSALTVRYGEPFLHRWRELDLGIVKGDWARELAGFGTNLQALRYALDHLPEKPPTVIEFRKLCNDAPRPQVQPYLPNDARTRGPTAEEREHIAHLMAELSSPNRASKDWAHQLLERHARGDRRPGACVAAARAAIASPTFTEDTP